MTNILSSPAQETKDKITLWLNHLLVLYAFLIPIHNGAKSSMFFTMLALFLYRRDYWFYLKEAFSNRIIQAILAFYLLHAVGLLYTDNMEYGKDHMDKIKYFLFPLVFISFLDIRFAFRIIGAFIFGMFFSIVFSYLIHFGFLPYEFSIGKYEIWETFAYSPAPFIAHSDHGVGISLLVGFLLYYILNFKNEDRFKKFIALVIIITALANMSFIASRTGYMTLVVVIFITLVLSFRENIKYFILASLLFFSACLFLYNFSNTINERINQLGTNFNSVIKSERYFQSGSTGIRIGLTIYGIEVIKDHPLIGTGTGDHMDLLREKYPEDQKGLDIISKPHNLYVQIPMQHGVLGVMFFIYILYTIFTYKNISREKKDIMLITIVSALVFMAGGLLYGTFELPLLMVLISAMIAKKQQNITVNKIDLNLLLKYFAFIVLFLIIGITR